MKLKAPNGKPSNLNAEQYKLVRTPAFKKWFGDWENDPENASKVVDENGEPMVVYHGTDNKFNQFTYESARNSASGLEPIFGFYFSVRKQTKNNSYGKYISPCFLNIKNNLSLDYRGRGESLPKIKLIKLKGRRKVISDFYIKDGKEWIMRKVMETYRREGEIVKMPSHGQLRWIWEAYYSDDKTIEEFQKAVTKIFRVDGYYMETLGYENWIAFHPNQIKLADGSNTTFDGSNDDIRYEDGGTIKLKLDKEHSKKFNDENNLLFYIFNQKGEQKGRIGLLYREDLGGYQIWYSKVTEKGKGIGKKAYIELRKILGKPIISDSSRTQDAENLWKSIERNNLGFFDEKIGKYKMYKDGGNLGTWNYSIGGL